MGAYQNKTDTFQKNIECNSEKGRKNSDERTSFFTNSPQDIQQRKIQEIADNSKQVSQLKAIQSMANNGGTALIQRKAMTPQKLYNGNFSGPHQGNTFQYNFPGSGGIHGTVRLAETNDATSHFHIRKDSKGGVYNRIDYNENSPNTWVESGVNVKAGDELKTQMQQKGTEMKNWIISQ